MKRIIALLLIAALMIPVLASCGNTENQSDATQYISEAQREEHIKMLIGDSELIAENKKFVTINEEDGTESINYIWTVSPDYATAVGKAGSNITVENEDGTTTTVKRGITNMSLMCENEYFALYMDLQDTSTDVEKSGSLTDFAVLDKTTGHVYHSDSNYEKSSLYANVNTPTSGTSATAKPDMKIINAAVSPIAIEAYDVTNKRYEFNFRENCLEDKRIQIVKLADNKFRLIYTIGNDPDKDLVPPVITEETWAWLVEKLQSHTELNEKGTKTVGEEKIGDLETCYKAVTPTSLNLEDKERFLKNYPLLDAIPMHIVRVLNTRQKQIVKEAMLLAGFTVEMLKAEMEAVEYSGPERAVMFTIPVDLTLTEEGLTVDIDSSLIQAPAKQKMYKISLLRAFASVTPSKKLTNPQYVIICDGSGSIMPAAGNVTQSVYTARVYGADMTFQKELEATKMMQIVSPFLIFDRSDLGGVMTILEDGTAQAFATVRPGSAASNPGTSINYDLVYAERDYRTYTGGQGDSGTSLITDNSSAGAVLSKEKQVANFRVSYYFTTGNLTYSEYAKIYRDYLIEKGKLRSETIQSGTKTPFYAEIFGAINRNESVAGIPVDMKKALTSYSELKQIVQELVSSGVANINIRYLYWSNEGYYNTVNSTPALIREMGSQAELRDLVSYLQSQKVGFYPSAEFMYIYKDKAFDVLNYTNDAARRLDMRVARVYTRDPAMYSTNTRTDYVQTVLTPDLISKLATTYKVDFDKIVGNKQISLGDIGKVINTNYKVGRILNRTQAYDEQIAAIELFANDGYDMLFTTGNDYTWKYADHIVNLPVGASEYLSTTGSIPFIQMVLHGYISYAADPFNISADYETLMLKCLETGSGVIFRWMYDDNTVFDNTDFFDFYSLNYKDSFDRAVSVYKEVASVLDGVTSEPITLHETAESYLVSDYVGEITMLQEGDEGYVEGVDTPSVSRISTGGVFHVVYGDGKLDLYINYNSYDVELADRTVVPALGYLEVK